MLSRVNLHDGNIVSRNESQLNINTDVLINDERKYCNMAVPFYSEKITAYSHPLRKITSEGEE